MRISSLVALIVHVCSRTLVEKDKVQLNFLACASATGQGNIERPEGNSSSKTRLEYTLKM